MKKPAVEYVRDQVMYAALSDRYYFVPKAKRLGGGTMEVVGKKIDVTESVRFLITVAVRDLEQKRKKAAARKRAAKKRTVRLNDNKTLA